MFKELVCKTECHIVGVFVLAQRVAVTLSTGPAVGSAMSAYEIKNRTSEPVIPQRYLSVLFSEYRIAPHCARFVGRQCGAYCDGNKKQRKGECYDKRTTSHPPIICSFI